MPKWAQFSIKSGRGQIFMWLFLVHPYTEPSSYATAMYLIVIVMNIKLLFIAHNMAIVWW